MGNVRFELDAESGKAVAAFLRVVDAQKKGEKGFRDMTNAGGGLEGALGRIDNKLRAFATSAAGYFSVATLKTFAQNYTQELERAGAAGSKFEDTMTELLSLGENMDKSGALKDQVLTLSGALGKGSQEIADAMATLQGSSPNLSKAIQDSLLRGSLDLSRLTSTESRTSLMLLVKAFQLYGDELKTVSTAQSRLFGIAEAGDIRFADLAQNFPEVMAAARAMGFSFDEVGASLSVASLRAGKAEPTYTGLRNILLKLNSAAKEGIPLTGGFVDQLEQLSKHLNALPPQERKALLIKIFDERTIAIAQVLLENIREIRKELHDLQNVPDDIVTKKIGKRLTDPAFLASETRKRAVQAQENVDVLTGQDPRKAWKAAEWEMRVSGAKSKLPIGFQWLAKPFSFMETYGPGGAGLGAGLKQQIDALEAAGNWTEAGYLRLRYSKITGTKVPFNLGKATSARSLKDLSLEYPVSSRRESGGALASERDAERFLELRNKGFNMTLPAFLHMRAREVEGDRLGAMTEMSRAAGVRQPEDYLAEGMKGFVDGVGDFKEAVTTILKAAEAFRGGAGQPGNLARDRLPATRPVNPNLHVE